MLQIAPLISLALSVSGARMLTQQVFAGRVLVVRMPILLGLLAACSVLEEGSPQPPLGLLQ